MFGTFLHVILLVFNSCPGPFFPRYYRYVFHSISYPKSRRKGSLVLTYLLPPSGALLFLRAILVVTSTRARVGVGEGCEHLTRN